MARGILVLFSSRVAATSGWSFSRCWAKSGLHQGDDQGNGVPGRQIPPQQGELPPHIQFEKG